MSWFLITAAVGWVCFVLAVTHPRVERVRVFQVSSVTWGMFILCTGVFGAVAWLTLNQTWVSGVAGCVGGAVLAAALSSYVGGGRVSTGKSA